MPGRTVLKSETTRPPAQLGLFPIIERERLEGKYSGLLSEKLDYRTLVSYVANKHEPIFNWFRYKEAFSRGLVEKILLREWSLPFGTLIFDPFAGCGTTLLTSRLLGYSATGIDIMPLAVFVSRVKLHLNYDLEQLAHYINVLLSEPVRATAHSFPKVHIVDLALSREIQEELLFYREEIQSVSDPATRDFLMLGLLSSIEEASYTAKDGQFLRLIKRKPKPLGSVLRNRLGQMIDDLRTLWANEVQRSQLGEADIFLGDARAIPDTIKQRCKGKVDGVITSPPYLNRYDYSRTYALELCLLYDEKGLPCVKDFEDLKNIRHSLLRSHIESRPAPTNLVKVPALEEVLANLAPKNLNNPRIPIMIDGYFEDMNLAIHEMADILAPDGRVALVVANARFEGELVPVDLILSEIAEAHGLHTTGIWVTRYKGNSSQQMGHYGRVPVRESIVFWQKRDWISASRRKRSAVSETRPIW